MTPRRALLLAPLGAARPAAAAEWRFDERDGALRLSVRTLGLLRAEGVFRRFRLRLAPGAGLRLEAEAASLELSPSLAEARVKGPEWFDAANHPLVAFAAPAPPEGASEADATLTLRGLSRPVPTRFAWSPGAGALEASAEIRRSAFGLVADQAAVSDRVSLALSVVRRQAQ